MSPENGNTVIADAEAQRFWRSRTRLVQWRINAAWWLEALQPVLLLGALVLTSLVLIGRRAGWTDTVLLWSTLVIVTAVISATTLLARRHFVSASAACAELEARLGLNSRLSAAAAGVGTWPSVNEWRSRLWYWNWRKLGTLPLLSSLLLLGAFLVPIVGQQERRLPPSVKPPALAAVEEWLKALEQNQSIDPSSLEPLQEQAEQLAKQDPLDLYSHANLEAANHLQAQLQDGMRTLDQNAAALQSLLEPIENMSDAAAKRWNEQFGGALGAMSGNAPTLSRSLNQQLRELDPSKLRSLTPEQLQQLQKQLKEARGACKECLRDLRLGETQELGDKEGDDGNGGIDRGPGHPPLTLKSEETNLNTDKTEGLESEQISQSALGDLAGLSDGQHQVDKAANHRAAQGGKAAAEGAGPDAVWIQQSLRPEERQRLRQFYK